MELNQATMQYLTRLCRIDCTGEEQAELLHNLQQMIGYFSQLNEIDTEHVTPCSHVIDNLSNVMREDCTGEVLDRTTFLKNAPAVTANLIRVPPPFKQH